MDLNLQSRADYETWDVSKNAVTGKNGIVVAQEIEAANTGKQVLLEGGNAVDAAVATALALCVTEPWMSGLGGGGFINKNIRKEVLTNNLSFWLNWRSSTIIKRILKSKKRPIAFKSNENDLRKLINERAKIYSKANFRINCENLTKSMIVKQIVELNEKN